MIRRATRACFVAVLASIAAACAAPRTLDTSQANISCGRHYEAMVQRTRRCEGIDRPPEILAEERARYLRVCGASFEAPGTGMNETSLELCTRNAVNLPCGADESDVCGVQVGRCAGDAPPVTFGDVGAECGSVTAKCKGGLVCLEKKCVVPSAEGASCNLHQECQAPLLCIRNHCAPRVVRGGPCDRDAANMCQAGLGCDESGHCSAVERKKAGEPCDGLTIQCERGNCPAIMTGSGTGVCPTILADGQACDRSDPNVRCDDWAECTNGTCQLAIAACQ